MISRQALTTKYQHALWIVRNHSFILWFRTFPLVYIIVIASVIAWVIITWYQLFYTIVLTPEQTAAVRAANAPITFDKEQFRTQVDNQRTRQHAITANASLNLPDILYPSDYPREKLNR